MLYDKRWEKPEIKSDPLSLESLIGWLEKQPTDKHYCYIDGGRCLLTKYFSGIGFKRVYVTPFSISLDGSWLDMPRDFDEIAVGPHLKMPANRETAPGWTFGAALKRARAALAER